MSFSQFVTSRTFLKHLLIALGLIFIMLLITTQGLKMYTEHGESKPVPDFSGLTKTEAQEIARQNHLRIEVIDSLFADDAQPGTIVDQVPEKGHAVKNNRKIFLTINSLQPELVTLPRLTNISFRQAQVLLESSGLQVGEIIYQPSEYNDLVLNVQMNSNNIRTGKKLPKGTKIDLVVGRTRGNLSTPLPDLTGMNVDEAKNALTDAMLNAGVVIYDESVLSSEDSLNAVVWRQSPDPRITATANLGSSVDLWVTVDQLKVDDALEQNF